MKTIPQVALNTIKVLEGLPGTNGAPALKAYKDSAGVWTAGFGHTRDVREGQVCTMPQALAWLHDDTQEAADAVEDNVVVPLNENQLAALIIFVFNIGAQEFVNSTLLRVLNTGEYAAVPAQLNRWIYAKVRKDGKVTGKRIVPGLVNRRAAEVSLWLSPTSNAVNAVPAPAYNRDTAGEVAAVPPNAATLMQTSTGKAGVASVVTGGTAALIQAAQQADPIISAVERVKGLTAGVPDILTILAVLLVVGCVGSTVWMLIERLRKLREEHK